MELQENQGICGVNSFIAQLEASSKRFSELVKNHTFSFTRINFEAFFEARLRILRKAIHLEPTKDN